MSDRGALDAVLDRLAKGDLTGAEAQLLQDWSGKAPMSAEALDVLARIRIAQNRPEEAAQCLTSAIAAAPSDPRYYRALGDLYTRAGEWTAAIELFAEAVRLAPTQADLRRAYARALLGAGRNTDAEREARALLRNAADSDAWDILSRALRDQGRVSEALAAADEAVRLAPAAVYIRHNRALTIAHGGDVEAALREFESLAARGVRASALAVNHATALQELGRNEEAEHVLAEAIGSLPADPALHTALAKVRWLLGAGDAFSATFETAVANYPDVSALRISCVDVLRRAGALQKGEALLREGLQRRPGDNGLAEALAVLLDESGRTEEALPLLQRAFERAPSRADGRSLYARALLRLGYGKRALDIIAPMREAEPISQLWICLESMALRQIGDPRYHWLCDYDLMVGAFDLPVPDGYPSIAAFNTDLAVSLLNLHAATDHPLDQTLRGGTQSSRNLLHVDDAVIRAYFQALRAPINDYIARMRDLDHPWSGRRTSDFAFAGAWSVRLKPGGHHVNHFHPAGWISSAYYVALPQVVHSGVGQEGWIKFGEPPQTIPGCHVEKVVQPQVGRLVLFPSYMWHGTIPFSEGERLTAPFDVIPV